jgi:hypothetical protein
VLLRLSGCVSVLEGDESKLGFGTQLRISHCTEDLEKRFELLFGSLRIHVFHDKIEHLHRLLELVSALLQFKGSLLFSLSLSYVKNRLLVGFIFSTLLFDLAELIDGFLSILPVFEADESEAFALLILILHDDSAHDFTEVRKLSF